MTHVLVPQEPTETMWSGLARDLVMWCRFDRPTGSALYTQLKMLGKEIPDWLAREIPDTDHVPPKGTVAACIYKAMLAVVPKPEPNAWLLISTARKDGSSYLLKLRDDLQSIRPDLERWSGIQFVGSHPGLGDDGFDIGWSFAAPVGVSGFPDEWFVGWKPLSEPFRAAKTLVKVPGGVLTHHRRLERSLRAALRPFLKEDE